MRYNQRRSIIGVVFLASFSVSVLVLIRKRALSADGNHTIASASSDRRSKDAGLHDISFVVKQQRQENGSESLSETFPYNDGTEHANEEGRLHAAEHVTELDAWSDCYSDDCIETKARSLSRAFPKHSIDNWCVHESKSSSGIWQGLILVKTVKAASSTAAGVAWRISERRKCAMQWKHRKAFYYREHDQKKTFFYSILRDPVARVISHIFFAEISRKGIKPTDEFILHQLQSTNKRTKETSQGRGGFQLNYVSPRRLKAFSAWKEGSPDVVLNPDQVEANVKRVIKSYNFLVVVDRLDESLVAMSMLMGIELGDILVTFSKVAGASSYSYLDGKCKKLKKSTISPMVKQYLESKRWRAENYGDYLLLAAARHSLDRTIEETIGRQIFEDALKEYRRLRALEEEICAPHAQFPCSNDGEPQLDIAAESCLNLDFACGNGCIDEMLRNDTLGLL